MRAAGRAGCLAHASSARLQGAPCCRAAEASPLAGGIGLVDLSDGGWGVHVHPVDALHVHPVDALRGRKRPHTEAVKVYPKQ